MRVTWRDQFREENELLLRMIRGWPLRIYMAIAYLTFFLQMRARMPLCEGASACWATTIKAAVWSVVWPFYWINYATDFILFRPYG